MHKSAMDNGQRFFETYGIFFQQKDVIVCDIGSRDYEPPNGSLKKVVPSYFKYVGLDTSNGYNVDIILKDPYHLPLQNNSVDIVLSSSCFEHNELFWITYLEIMRILKPHGLFYLNAPSNGHFHRYPVDCWRFYPDSAQALVKWSKLNGINTGCLETYISHKDSDIWNDFVSIFIKDVNYSIKYPNRILNNFKNFKNGIINENSCILNEVQEMCND